MAEPQEREYLVKIEKDPDTNRKLREQWWANETRPLLHREDGPAIQTWDKDTGVLVSEWHYFFGTRHRDDGPSRIERHPVTGETLSESWSYHDVLHRTDGGPALWRKDPETGVVTREEYWQSGVEHREGGGPAVIYRDRATGAVTYQGFYDEGDLIREEEPSPPEGLEP